MTKIEDAINFLVTHGEFDCADQIIRMLENDQRLKDYSWAKAGEIDQLAAENHRLKKQIQILQARLYLNKLPHDVLEGTDD